MMKVPEFSHNIQESKITGLNPQQQRSCETIKNSEYFVKELPQDFYSKPLGTFAITQADSPEIFKLSFVSGTQNEIKVNELLLTIKPNGNFAFENKEDTNLHQLLNNFNSPTKIVLGIPLKIINELIE